MEENKEINFNNDIKDKPTINDNKSCTFDRLCNLQKLIKRESILRELCKVIFYLNLNLHFS